jgi:hypothetical protein
MPDLLSRAFSVLVDFLIRVAWFSGPLQYLCGFWSMMYLYNELPKGMSRRQNSTNRP